eukprot:gene5506-6191_t
MGKLKGGVMFKQENISSMLTIDVQFDRISQTGLWGVFTNPVIFHAGPADSCSSDVIGQLVNNGNLTQIHGRFGYRAVYNNAGLRATGKSSILGASLVMHDPNTLAPWGCATILPFNTPTNYAVATFNGVVAGQVQFLQNGNNASSEVAIIGQLYFTDGRTVPSNNHGWFISSSSASGYNQCDKLTNVLQGRSTSTGTCSEHEPGACEMGDLSSKLNNISIGIANDAVNAKKFRLIDISLNISAIQGHALVIKDSRGVPFACANIMKDGPLSMSSSFDAAKHDGVSGAVSFTQESPYHPTKINFKLNGLNDKAKGIHVHQFPIPDPAPATNPCAGAVVGAHLNPYGINNKASNYPADGSGASLDKYEVGDISGKFGNLAGSTSNYSQYEDLQMGIYGRYSIFNRAVVIHRNDATGSRWVCSNILPEAISKSLSSTANFGMSSDLDGTVNLRQYMLSNGIMTQTAMTVALSYKDKSKITNNHNWHIHIEPVGNDGKAAISKRCKSVAGHYNPFAVNVDKPAYSSQCSPNAPHRCELGDLSAKQAKYNIGAGKKYFVDPNTPLFGSMSVIGRSVTFHTENAGAPRLACADVIPDSIAAVAKIEFSYKNEDQFNKTDFRQLIMKLLALEEWQVTYIKTLSPKKHCDRLSFYVIDMRSQQQGSWYKKKFQSILDYQANKLGKYKKCSPVSGMKIG